VDNINDVKLCASRGTEILILITNSSRIGSVSVEYNFKKNNQKNSFMREPVESVRYNWDGVVIPIVETARVSGL
jgi:hypothetical protein